MVQARASPHAAEPSLKSAPAFVGRELLSGDSFSLSVRDAVLYALGVGAGRLPSYAGADELRWVYEGAAGFCPLPSLGTLFPFLGGGDLFSSLRQAGLDFDPALLLHAGHELTLHAPLREAFAAPLVNRTVLASVADRDAGALVTLVTRTTCGGRLLATNAQTVFIRGLRTGSPAGGGGRAASSPPPADAASWTERVEHSAALLYRLSGDLNPLHVDAGTASHAGFPRPILHGLCTLGHAVRAVLRRLCIPAEAVRRLRVRFVGVVFPGDELATVLWRAGPGLIRFEARVGEALVLGAGEVELEAFAKL
jgi:peroxisomal enoyl-CoA hydratase 2